MSTSATSVPSTYLEHLLIANWAGELCACPEGIEAQLDHAWPTAMNDIHREVGEPLAKKLDVVRNLCDTRDDKVDRARRTINDLCDQLDAEHCLRHRLEEKLAKYKGKQREESEATMDSPLPRKQQGGCPTAPNAAGSVHAGRYLCGGSNTSAPKVNRRPWGTRYP